jgi:hypothetical protein
VEQVLEGHLKKARAGRDVYKRLSALSHGTTYGGLQRYRQEDRSSMSSFSATTRRHDRRRRVDGVGDYRGGKHRWPIAPSTTAGSIAHVPSNGLERSASSSRQSTANA